MDIRKFVSGEWVKQGGIKVFHPKGVHHNYTWKNTELNTLLEKACLSIGELNGLTATSGTAAFSHAFLVLQAITACGGEAPGLKLETALMTRDQVPAADRPSRRKADNYVRAVKEALGSQAPRPVSSKLISQIHKQLLEGLSPDGEDQTAGAFRKTQIWKGEDSISDASYIPPDWQDIPDLMEDLVDLLNNKDTEVPALVRIAIAHYQLKTILPFTQANNRVSNALFPVFLVNSGILHRPFIDLPGHFLANGPAYRHQLETLREKDKLASWLRFFLAAVIDASALAIKRLKVLHALKLEKERAANSLGKRAGNALKLLEYLYEHPVVAAPDITNLTEVSKVTVYKLIEDFIEKGILHETKGLKRNRIFIFSDYLAVFEN